MHRQDVNLFEFPQFDERFPAEAGVELTLGDLHGNAVKLLYTLIKHGIVTNLTENDYKEILAIYCWELDEDDRQLSRAEIKSFDDIVEKMAVKNVVTLRLIGDVLADRGSNDYFTLKIIRKLRQQQLPIEILISNHDIEFIEACEKGKELKAPRIDFNGQTRSMNNLRGLVNRNLCSLQDVHSLYHDFYKSTLKAVSYTVDANGRVSIYTHACTDIGNVADFAKELKVEFSDDSIEQLTASIDRINSAFQMYAQSNTIHKLCNNFSTDRPTRDSVFEMLMWNRNTGIIKREPEHKGYSICYVHGHDMRTASLGHVINLDNMLGKFNLMWGFNQCIRMHMEKGEYNIYFIRGRVVQEELKVEATTPALTM